MDDLDADAIQRLVADIPSQSARLEIEKFLREYHRLKKTLARLVKHADRTEKKLEQAATEAAEKSQEVQELSKQLAKYLSPQIYSQIFEGGQHVSLSSSRKKLTVFFSDIVDFTKTSDSMESEELTTMLNFYLTEMTNIALEYGATIDKYVGDAIVIFFGDPESLGVKEDAIRCVQMAKAMATRLKQISDTWQDFGLERPLQIRMGIHTGYCTVGNFGSENRMDYTVIGNGVNLAARLESAAKPGQILMSFDTFAQVRDSIACVERDQIQAKGFAGEIRTFEAILDEENSSLLPVNIGRNQLTIPISDLSTSELQEIQTSLKAALEKIGQNISAR